jgi:hypothetical protein
MPFGKYGDILKKVEDIFKKDFSDGTPVTLEVNQDVPIKGTKLTSTSTHDFSAGSKLNNTLSLEWEHDSGFKLDKLEFDPTNDGSFVTECSLSGLMDGVKLDFKGDDKNKADITARYDHEQATVTATVDATDFKSFGATLSSGFNDVKFGLSGSLKGEKTNLDAAISYSAPKMFFGLNLTNTFQDIKGLFTFAVDSNVTVAAKCTYGTKDKNVGADFAAVYACNPKTTIKAKVDLDKNINLSVKQAVAKGLTTTAWTKVSDLSPKSAQFGAKIVLG